MALSKAPGVILPTVPGMGSSTPTRGTSGRARAKVVKVPAQSLHVKGAVKAPKIRVVKPKMPKDAMALRVPHAKRVKNGKEFTTKLKPVI